MAKGCYIGDSSSKAKKVKKIYIGDGSNVARKVKKVYIGDENGKARLAWQSGLNTIVVVGGNSGSSSYLGIAYSINKGTFINANYNTMAYSAEDVCYGENKFVAVGSNTGYADRFGPHYSYDGITWTQNAGASLGGYRAYRIIYTNGYYISWSNWTSILYFSYSTDGIKWKRSSKVNSYDDTIYRLLCVTYCNGKYWVGSTHGAIYKSDSLDGTWTIEFASKSGLTTNTDYNVTAFATNGTNKLICHQAKVGIFYYDFNQNKWIKSLSYTDGDCVMSYGNNKFYIVLGVYSYTSTDGITWTKHGYAPARDVYFDGEHFLCCEGNSPLAFYLKDGNEGHNNNNKLILPHTRFVAIAGA